MELVQFILILMLCMSSYARGASTPGTVNLGAIFTFSTINGRVSKIAIKAAEKDINSDPRVLGGRKLSIKMHDSNFSGFLGIIGALQFMETETIAIIGPQNAVMAHVLSHLANELHVPLLSFTALDPTLSPLQYPYFVQTAPNDLFQMTAIAEMISYYGWSEVIAVYSDDDQSRNGVTILGDQLAERRCKISYKAALPPDPKANRSDAEAELVKILSLESRVIVLHTFAKTGRLVLDVAQSLGMVDNGFVWIASTWLSTVLDSTPFPSKNPQSIHGVLTLRPHTPDSKRKRNFVSRWNQLSNGSIGFNPYALYAYDTVWTIAHAVKSFLDQGNNISFSNNSRLSGLGGGTLNLGALSVFDGGSQLLNNILHTNMTGLSGPIHFNEDRFLPFPSYDIINIREKGYRHIGYWSSYSGLSVVTPEELYRKPPNRSIENQHLLNVVWPGGGTTTPRGWIFPHNGRKLRIGIPRRVSFLNFVQVGNDSNVHGFCIEVFLAAIKLLPYAVPFELIPYGDGHRNPNYYELVNQITSGDFDAVVGDVAIVMNRTKIVDFTQPYIESGLVVVAPVKKLNSSAWEFLKPFTPLMWAVTAIFFLLVGVVIWILEHRANDEFRGPPKKQLVTVLWFSFSTMFNAHRENTVSSLGRLVLIIWLFVVLIINSSYIASLTSILTVKQLSSPIKSIDTLIASNQQIGYQVGSFAENYLYDELNIPKSRVVALNSPEEYAEALSNGTVAAVVEERPYVDLFLSQYCGFSVRGNEFTKSGWGFAFPRDSPLAVDMSTAILRLSENGELQKIHDRLLPEKLCSSQSDSGSYQLQLESFRGLFLVSGVVCFLALLVYFCIMLHQFKSYAPKESISSTQSSSRSRRLQTFLSFADEKIEESKSKSKRKRGDMVMDGYIKDGRSFNGSGIIEEDVYRESPNSDAWLR